jgi:group I intron endonuclease
MGIQISLQMKNKIISGIYKITNPNGGIYIGRSKNILKRWNEEYRKLKCKKQIRLYRSLLKYGVENHTFEIVHECLEVELNDLEIYYIKHYDCFNTPLGLNLRSGGNKGIDSDETKIRKSLCQLGEKSAGWGKKQSKESNIKRRNSSSGEKSYMFGVPKSDEIKDKIRLALKGRKLPQKTIDKMTGRKLSKKTLKKMRSVKRSEEFKANLRRPLPKEEVERRSATRLRGCNHPLAKAVINVQTGIFYDTLREALKSYGGRKCNFQPKLAGKRKNNTPFIYA